MPKQGVDIASIILSENSIRISSRKRQSTWKKCVSKLYLGKSHIKGTYAQCAYVPIVCFFNIFAAFIHCQGALRHSYILQGDCCLRIQLHFSWYFISIAWLLHIFFNKLPWLVLMISCRLTAAVVTLSYWAEIKLNNLEMMDGYYPSGSSES